EAASGREIAVLRGHEQWVSSAAFNPDGTRVVTASWDKTARVWDPISGRELVVLRGHDDYVNSAAFSSDGIRIVTASKDGTARIYDCISVSDRYRANGSPLVPNLSLASQPTSPSPTSNPCSPRTIRAP
ncbi:MAG: hypothetical protein K8R87_08980, partial [Verrucomicrobia bacterium]|nr:hypothetical protein [Verrucomicrobiota bacterium]